MVSEAECPRAWARSQPKCELHRHLEGAIRGADLLAALRDLKDSTVEGDVTAEKLVTRLALLEPLKVRRRARARAPRGATPRLKVEGLKDSHIAAVAPRLARSSTESSPALGA